MIAECIDQSLQQTANLMSGTTSLFNPDRFVNPQTALIAQAAGSSAMRQEAILSLVAGSSLNGTQKNTMMQLYNGFSNLGGGGVITGWNGVLPIFADSPALGMLGAYKNMTDFFSGKLSIFPIDGLPGIEVPGMALLGTMTFAGLLGVAKGGLNADNALCKVDPAEPCQSINKIFASIMGAYDTALSAIASGLNLMTDLLNSAADYLNDIQEFINQIADWIIQGISAVVEALANAVRYALAKLLNALKLDPCIGTVLELIAGPELKESLGM